MTEKQSGLPSSSLPDTVSAQPVSPEVRRRLLVEWNQTASDYPQDQCVHWLFEAMVRKMPDAPAVEIDRKSVV